MTRTLNAHTLRELLPAALADSAAVQQCGADACTIGQLPCFQYFIA